MTARVDRAVERIGLRVYGLGRWISFGVSVPASAVDRMAEALAAVVAKAEELNAAETAALIEAIRDDARREVEHMRDIADGL